MPKEEVKLPDSTAAQLVKRTEEEINPKQILDWQQYFKKSPNAKKLKIIKESIHEDEKKVELSTEDLLRLARNLRSIGEITRSEVKYREVLRRDSDHFDATIEISEIYQQQQLIEKSFDYIASAKRILASYEKPGKAKIFRYKYALANGLINSQRRQEGHKILSELIVEDRKFINGYLSLAASYLKDQKLELTKFIANRGLDQAPNNPILNNILGVVSQMKGQRGLAKKYFNKALEKNSDLVPALVNRANISIQSADYKSAELDLNRALKNAPYYTNAMVSQGILFKKTGRYSSAKVSFQSALDRNPENAFARYNLAVLTADNFKDQNEALRLFYEVLQSNELSPEIQELAQIQIQGLRDSRISFGIK